MIEERRAKGAKGFNVAAERMRLSNLREYEAGRGNADAVAKCGHPEKAGSDPSPLTTLPNCHNADWVKPSLRS